MTATSTTVGAAPEADGEGRPDAGADQGDGAPGVRSASQATGMVQTRAAAPAMATMSRMPAFDDVEGVADVGRSRR